MFPCVQAKASDPVLDTTGKQGRLESLSTTAHPARKASTSANTQSGKWRSAIVAYNSSTHCSDSTEQAGKFSAQVLGKTRLLDQSRRCSRELSTCFNATPAQMNVIFPQ